MSRDWLNGAVGGVVEAVIVIEEGILDEAEASDDERQEWSIPQIIEHMRETMDMSDGVAIEPTHVATAALLLALIRPDIFTFDGDTLHVHP